MPYKAPCVSFLHWLRLLESYVEPTFHDQSSTSVVFVWLKNPVHLKHLKMLVSLSLSLQSRRCSSPPALEGPLNDVRSDGRIDLKGDGTGDTRVDDASGVVHDATPLLVLEAPDRCAQRPLHDGRDQERYHSQRRPYHLAPTRVLVCPALHTQRNRHRRGKKRTPAHPHTNAHTHAPGFQTGR